jgi:histidyl-tRNA synthetase
MSAVSLLRGTRDLLPGEADAFAWVLGVHRTIASLYGYRPIETPIFEATELFARGIGAGTDVVDKEMYTFDDRSTPPHSLTLRPENTPAAVRAVLGAHLTQAFRPVRVRYEGPMFRYDKPQHGRYRQFWQVGAECIGDRSPTLDAEVIELAWRFHEALGLTGMLLQINTLGDIEDRIRYRAALVDYYTPLRERLCTDCKRRLNINPLRLLDCKTDAALVARAPRIAASLSSTSAAYFAAVLEALDQASIPYDVNDRLVRGLDYYAHTTFEFWHGSLAGAQNALGGGGRYDGLAEVLGFPATPAAGYALGVDRLVILAAEQGVLPATPPAADVLVYPVEPAQVAAASRVARRLREDGIPVVLDAAERRLDRKLRTSDRLGACAAVIVGADDEARHRVTVRDLRAHSQQTVDEEAALATVRALLMAAGGAMGGTG